VGRRYGIQPDTARVFMHKVREGMKSSGNYPMDGEVHVDEFVVGGKESERPGRSYGGKKKKLVCAIELTKQGKVKRFYGLQIKDFSAISLRPIFERHISKEAKVTTDEWKGYRPIAKDFQITQIPSDFGLNFKAINTAIHQVKSWIRTTFSWVNKRHIERYLNEYSFRTNRSQNKQTIFHILVKRIVNADKISVENLI
jgi:transposase-like protein